MKVSYNMVALASIICAMIVGSAALLTGSDTVDVIALTNVFVIIAGTIVGRKGN